MFPQSESPPAPVRSGTRHTRRVATASFVGTAIEIYDFNIYGLTAALIFGPQFFPTFSPVAGTLAAFVTFGAGFIARPLGSVVLSHLGDRVGRKSTLVASLVIMGAATFLTGLLPTYAVIGVWAPVLLVVLRLVQGFAVGGEWGGAVVLGVEHAPTHRRAFFGSFTQMGNPVGIVLASLTFVLLTTYLPADVFSSWGWRIPFLASIVLIGIGMWVRLGVAESPDFTAVQRSGAISRSPVWDLITTNWREMLRGGLSSTAAPTLGYLMFVYMLAYSRQALGLPPTYVLWLTVAAGVAWIPLVLVTARLADHIGRKPVLLGGLIGIVVWSLPFFALVNTGSLAAMIVAYLGGVIAVSFATGAQAAFIAELFPAPVRYSGTSMAYQLGSILGGGVAPIVFALLYARSGSSTPIAGYLLATAALSLVATVVLFTRGSARNGGTASTRPEPTPAVEGTADAH